MKDDPTGISTPFDGVQAGSELGNNAVAAQSRKLEQLSDDEFWDYAYKLAQLAPDAGKPEEYLRCTLSQGQCLMPLAALYEVVRPPHRIAPLPAMPPWMRGVVAWRGETIGVVDLEAYLASSSIDTSPESMLVIAEHAGLPLGLLVPAVAAAVSLRNEEGVPGGYIATSEIPAAASWCLPTRGIYVKGVQDQALVLDVDLLLKDMLQEIGGAASYG
ncbi:MAG: chemotaxis protein CheW [Ktedonobacteraceae bacterium]